MPENKKNIKRKLLISISFVVGIAAIACAAALLVAHFYISKVNIVTDDKGGAIVSGAGIPTNNAEEGQPGKEASREELDSMQKDINNNISNGDVSDLYKDDVFNVLVIGSDTRISGQRARSDSMVLLSVNKATWKIAVTSFMRDIYLQIPGHGYNRLNAAYAYGGMQLLLDTLELNFKIKVEKYVEFDFYSFAEFVDALGGVTVNVKDSDIESINESVAEVNYYLGLDSKDGTLKEGGLLTLNGKQTLGHVRNRAFADGDFTRTENQREVVTQLCSKVFKLSLSEANDLLCTYLPQITTNLSESEILAILVHMPDYATYGINQLCVPTSDSFSYVKINGMSVLQLNFSKNVDAVHETIYGDGTN